MSSLGWGQGTWGNNQWGGFENVTVSVTGTGLTASLGTIPAVHSAAPLPIFLGWGEGGWDQNRWGGRESTAFGANDDGFGLTASVGSVTVTGTGSVSLTGVNATTTLDFDPTTDILINETAVIDFRDSLMATSFSQEFGLTVDGFVQDGQTISNGSDTEDITNTERTQDIVLAAEMDLPSSFSKASTIWETGGTGSGAWFGISEQSGAYFLRFRAGDGTVGNNTTSNSLAIAQVAVSSLSQYFDGNTHTVVWAIDRDIGKTEIYIDGQLVAEGQTSDGSFVQWAGGANGAFGRAEGTPAGGDSDDGSTQFQSGDAFTGTIRSDLRMYKNEFIATQTAPASMVGNVSIGVTQSQISSNIGSVDFDGDANVPVTGFQASVGLGSPTIVANLSFSVTGFGLTASLGEENAAAQTKVFPTTVVGTGGIGNSTITGASNLSVTGLTGTGAVGNTTLVGTGNAIGAWGSHSVGAVGTATAIPSIEVNVTGVAGTGSIGDALAAGGAKVTETGLTGSVNIGDEAVLAGANVFPSGVSCESLLGDTRTGVGSDDTGTGTDIIFTVTVVGGNPTDHPYYNVSGASSNKFAINGSTATAAVTLTLEEGKTYRFDQSDSSNSGHPLRFSTTPNGTHVLPSGGGTQYTTGVTAIGTPGTAGAYTEITVQEDSPTLYYYCTNHSGMGWTAQTFNSTVNVIGNSTVIPTGVSATNSVGDEGVGLLLTISLTGTGLSGTTGLGTLAITAGSVVVLTGVGGVGSVGTTNLYGVIIPDQTTSYSNVTPNQNANWAA